MRAPHTETESDDILLRKYDPSWHVNARRDAGENCFTSLASSV